MEELQPRRGPGRPPKPEIQAETPRRNPNRKPFGAMEQKLAYPEREGFHRHWFNDTPGRIQRAQEAGYNHVQDSDGKNVQRNVGVAEGGGALVAFLMEIPLEWYQEDMKLQQDQRDETENAIKRGQFESKEGDGRYIPSQGIHMHSTKSKA